MAFLPFAAGGVELCLVAGDSGIGKTALVGEIVRSLVGGGSCV